MTEDREKCLSKHHLRTNSEILDVNLRVQSKLLVLSTRLVHLTHNEDDPMVVVVDCAERQREQMLILQQIRN
ncbi:hypothetical protein TNCV_1982031 [Trichonephila clavipes]|nr:hypothetical protein TNCV_1982031 [Trichonephila clavipes]